LSDELLTGVYEWRLHHPKATLTEIEAAIDERLARLRTQLLQDAACATPATDWRAAPPAERPRCPQCQTPLQPRGTQPRTLQTHGGRDLILERTYGVCPACEAGLFPPG
jgi:ribosomal protein L34E